MKSTKMFPTEEATGKGNNGWKWVKYKCKLCPAIVSHNLRRRHARNRHANEFKLVPNLNELFKELPREGEKVVVKEKKVQSRTAV